MPATHRHGCRMRRRSCHDGPYPLRHQQHSHAAGTDPMPRWTSGRECPLGAAAKGGVATALSSSPPPPSPAPLTPSRNHVYWPPPAWRPSCSIIRPGRGRQGVGAGGRARNSLVKRQRARAAEGGRASVCIPRPSLSRAVHHVGRAGLGLRHRSARADPTLSEAGRRTALHMPEASDGQAALLTRRMKPPTTILIPALAGHSGGAAARLDKDFRVKSA
jgi:hypothetical protein